MGTPEFAVPSLEALAGATELVGVVSQPDKPQGRGLAPAPSPVARDAIARRVPLIRPATLRDTETLRVIAGWRPDLIVVAAYGKILPRAVLELPALAAINVHASLLPRHRGASPIAASILAGDATTGVTIMAMTEAMDAGDILLQRAVEIGSEETTATLTKRLAALGASALAEALDRLRGAGLVAVAQDPALVSYASRLSKEDGRVRWSEPATTIERKVRAFNPWPSAFTALGGRAVKILRARLAPDAPETERRGHGALVAAPGAEPQTPAATGFEPGTVVAVGEQVRVATGTGAIDLLSLQMEGRKPLPARAFATGARLTVGARFDD